MEEVEVEVEFFFFEKKVDAEKRSNVSLCLTEQPPPTQRRLLDGEVAGCRPCCGDSKGERGERLAKFNRELQFLMPSKNLHLPLLSLSLSLLSLSASRLTGRLWLEVLAHGSGPIVRDRTGEPVEARRAGSRCHRRGSGMFAVLCLSTIIFEKNLQLFFFFILHDPFPRPSSSTPATLRAPRAASSSAWPAA